MAGLKRWDRTKSALKTLSLWEFEVDLDLVQSTLKVLTDSLVHAAVPLPWNIATVSTLCSLQPRCCFDCCNALRRESVNKNERGLKREHESKRERERVYYWPLIGYGESTALFCVACSQPIGCRNNILGLWMKWIVREQDRSSLIHQA